MLRKIYFFKVNECDNSQNNWFEEASYQIFDSFEKKHPLEFSAFAE
jgi:fructosamine-3-kinase